MLLVLLLGVAAAVPPPCGVSCTHDGLDSGLIIVTHDSTGTHDIHRCFKDSSVASGCSCMCKNTGDTFETSEDGTSSNFQVDGTASLAGVSLATANSAPFQAAFVAAVASTNNVSADDVEITTVTASSSRRRLSTGVSIGYTITAATPAAVQTIVTSTISAADLTTAVSQAYTGSDDLASMSVSASTEALFHIGTAGGRCDAAQVIDTEAKCREALAYLGNTANDIHWSPERGTRIIPKGCSLKHTVWHGNPHFNRFHTESLTSTRDDMTPICTGSA